MPSDIYIRSVYNPENKIIHVRYKLRVMCLFDILSPVFNLLYRGLDVLI